MYPYKSINHKQYTFSKDNFYQQGITQIDTVIHIGAFTPKTGQNANCIWESLTNVNNTWHLLNNLPNTPEKFIYLSTIDVYQTTTSIIDENTPTNPDSLYGWSKLLCEKIVEESAKTQGYIPQILRIGHIYGVGEEKYKKLIPETIKKICKDQGPIIFSDGSEKRSFLHISDCCNMLVKTLELVEYVGPINIVSGKSLSVKEIVELIINISGKNISCEIQNKSIPSRSYEFCNKKMEKYLCSEEVTLREGLTEEYEYISKLNII